MISSRCFEFLVDNIFVVFAGKVFHQIVGIPMGIICAPLLADLFIYSYEAKFIQSLLSAGRKQLASLTEIWEVSIEHLRRVWHTNRGRLVFRTTCPVSLGLAFVLLAETNHFPKLSLLLRTMLLEIPRYFLDLASKIMYFTRISIAA